MKSPITGKEMKVVVNKDTLIFRKEPFEILHHHYYCEDTGETFTDEVQENLNLTQVQNQYRSKYNIPFPDDIIKLRELYGLPATKMAEILGFGINVYRQYESGEVPSISNARLLSLAKDPVEFSKLVKMSNTFPAGEPAALTKTIESLKIQNKSFKDTALPDYLMSGIAKDCPGMLTGYKTPSLGKLIAMIAYFAAEIRPMKTKLNKLLFYADFLQFKKTCFSISGAEYVAITLGPVPNNFNSIFEYAAASDFVDIIYTEFSNGGVGEVFRPCSKFTFDKSIFSDDEFQTLVWVTEKFKNTSTQEMINLSHEEPGWLDNYSNKNKIEYKYAFTSKHLSENGN